MDDPVQELVDAPGHPLPLVYKEVNQKILLPVVHDVVPIKRTSRHFTRSSILPVWMKDYVTNVIDPEYPFSMSNYIIYDALSRKYQAYHSNISGEVEPRNYDEAVKDPRWVEATQQEIKALKENNTWMIVQLAEKKHPIGCK